MAKVLNETGRSMRAPFSSNRQLGTRANSASASVKVSGETPHMQQQRLRDTALAEAHTHLAADSVIQALQHHFEATVVAETVQPLLGA